MRGEHLLKGLDQLWITLLARHRHIKVAARAGNGLQVASQLKAEIGVIEMRDHGHRGSL